MDRIQNHLKEVWWLLLIRGIALVLFGVVAVVWPGPTLVIISVAFAAYLLIAGVVSLIAGIRSIGHMSLWFLTMLLGLAEIGVAIFLLKNNLALATFIAVLGISLIFYGIMEIIAAFEPGEESGRRFLGVITGALSLLAGFVVIRYPASSGLAFVWVLGVWGLVAGSIQVAMCLSLHSKFIEADRRYSSES